MKLSETLRQLADDLEQRPNEPDTWQRKAPVNHEWNSCKPITALHCLQHGYSIRRKPETGLERFEEWWSAHLTASQSSEEDAWDAWQEAERQAKEVSDGVK